MRGETTAQGLAEIQAHQKVGRAVAISQPDGAVKDRQVEADQAEKNERVVEAWQYVLELSCDIVKHQAAEELASVALQVENTAANWDQATAGENCWRHMWGLIIERDKNAEHAIR